MYKSIILSLLVLFSFTLLSQKDTPLPLITVTGHATVYADPDEALISFSIITTDNDILLAKQKNAEISRNTISYLTKEGVNKKHIQTQYLNVGINYRHERNLKEGKYQASQSFTVCVTDLENLEDIFIGLLGLNISNLGSPVFRSTKLESFKDEARKQSLANAKHKALLMTNELGQSIGKVQSISESNHNNNLRIAYSDSAENFGSGNSSGNSFALGQLEISAEITVSFIIE